MCTEVSAYSDTIEEAMNVVVYDPIKLANGMLDLRAKHEFEQKDRRERRQELMAALKHPVKLQKGEWLEIKDHKEPGKDAKEEEIVAFRMWQKYLKHMTIDAFGE